MGTTEERLVQLTPEEVVNRDAERGILAAALYDAHHCLTEIIWRRWGTLSPAERAPYYFAARSILAKRVA